MNALHGHNLEPFDDSLALDPADVARRLRVAGRAPSLDTVYRWMSRGCCSARFGEPLILPSVVVADRRRVMPQWVAVFAVLRDHGPERRASSRADTPRQTTARHRRAMERLKTMGLVGK
jgi:hypothetical protein